MRVVSSWGRGWSAWRAALRRGWWVGVLVAALVVLGAGAQYVRAARAVPYVATQTLQLAPLEPPTASTSDIAAANAHAASIARLLASGGLLASPPLDAAIATRMRADDPTLPGVTPGAVATSLSATHDATLVTLRTQWSSAQEAEALLRAAVEVLRGGALAAEPAVVALISPGAVLRVAVAGAPTGAVRDADALAVARGDLLARVGLGLLAGLLAALAGGALLMRRLSAFIAGERAPQE